MRRGASSQVREMKEKKRAYIGQDVYIGRPGRLPDVECCHLVFLYGCIIPTPTTMSDTVGWQSRGESQAELSFNKGNFVASLKMV